MKGTSGALVPAAAVSVSAGTRRTTTAKDGSYRLAGLAGGAADITALTRQPKPTSARGYVVVKAGVEVPVAPLVFDTAPQQDLSRFTYYVAISGSLKLEAEMIGRWSLRHETCDFKAQVPILPPGFAPKAPPATRCDVTHGDGTVACTAAAANQYEVRMRCREDDGSPDLIVRLAVQLEMGDNYRLRLNARHWMIEGDGEDDSAEWHGVVLPGKSVMLPDMSLQNPEVGEQDNAHLDNMRVDYVCPTSGCYPEPLQ